MDWVNTNLYREYGYHLLYPQIFPHHHRTPEAAQTSMLAWGKDKSEHWLGVLDKHIIGNHKYLAGDEISIADYLGAEIVGAGDLIGVKLDRFANVNRWMTSMKQRPNWKKVHEAVDGFAASLKGKPFVTIS
jgi:glutathione S-transferase